MKDVKLTMRYFVAVPVPEEVKTYLFGIQRQLKQLQYRFVSPDHFHVTLRFLGELTDDELFRVKERLRILQTTTRGSSKLTFIGGFPSNENARVLWAGCEKEHVFATLKKLVDRCVRDVAKQEEHDDFIPHITLGRSEKGVQLVSKQIPPVKQLVVPLEEVVLMSSLLTPEGPAYEVVERYTLQ